MDCSGPPKQVRVSLTPETAAEALVAYRYILPAIKEKTTKFPRRPPQTTTNRMERKMKWFSLCWFAVALAAAERLDPPTGPESGMANLSTSPDGSVYLSWIDPLGPDGHALRFSKWTGKGWSPAEEVARGKRWFINWADFPAIAVQSNGTMFAHWLTRPDDAGKYGYGIRLARRNGPGQWTQVFTKNLDEKEDYAGFLSFVPDASGAVYLAPPPEGGGPEGHRKTLRYLSLDGKGQATGDREIDPDVCSCCQTAVVKTPSGLLAAYRDHQANDIRDISVVRWNAGSWNPPRTVHADGWKINGCPTDGPTMAANGQHVALTWLTRADEKARVQIVESHDSGATFGPPSRVDEGNALGRPSVAVLDPTSDVIVWLEKTTDGKAEVRMRRYRRGGHLGKSLRVAEVPPGRAAGLPKVAVAGDQIIVAWRDARVRVAVLKKADL